MTVILVLVAHNGRTLAIEAHPHTRVDLVQDALVTLSGISKSDQIVICQGARLDPAKSLAAYKLPAGDGQSSEDQPVFLYNKAFLRPGCPPPVEEPLDPIHVQVPPLAPVPIRHPLQSAPSPLVRALPDYERQFEQHLKEAKAHWEASQARLQQGRELLSQQEVQARAADAARANVEAHYTYILGQYKEFCQKYAAQHAQHSALLARYMADLEILRGVLLPSSVRTSQWQRLVDLMDLTKMQGSYSSAQKMHEGLVGKVSEQEGLFAAVQKGVEVLLLQVPSVNLDQLGMDMAKNEELLDQQGTIVQTLSSDLKRVKVVVEESVQQLASHSLTSTSIHDTLGAMELMNDNHVRVLLPKVRECDAEVGAFCKRCWDAKQHMTTEVLEQLQRISEQQSRIREMKTRLVAFTRLLGSKEEAFGHLRPMQKLLPAYRCCLVECVRRKAWGEECARHAAALAEHMARFRDKEVARRQAFRQQLECYLSPEVLKRMGLLNDPPHCQVTTGVLDPDLMVPTPQELEGALGAQSAKDALQLLPQPAPESPRADMDGADEGEGSGTAAAGPSTTVGHGTKDLEVAHLKAKLASHVALSFLNQLSQQQPAAATTAGGSVHGSSFMGAISASLQASQKAPPSVSSSIAGLPIGSTLEGSSGSRPTGDVASLSKSRHSDQDALGLMKQALAAKDEVAAGLQRQLDAETTRSSAYAQRIQQLEALLQSLTQQQGRAQQAQQHSTSQQAQQHSTSQQAQQHSTSQQAQQTETASKTPAHTQTAAATECGAMPLSSSGHSGTQQAQSSEVGGKKAAEVQTMVSGAGGVPPSWGAESFTHQGQQTEAVAKRPAQTQTTVIGGRATPAALGGESSIRPGREESTRQILPGPAQQVVGFDIEVESEVEVGERPRAPVPSQKNRPVDGGIGGVTELSLGRTASAQDASSRAALSASMGSGPTSLEGSISLPPPPSPDVAKQPRTAPAISSSVSNISSSTGCHDSAVQGAASPATGSRLTSGEDPAVSRQGLATQGGSAHGEKGAVGAAQVLKKDAASDVATVGTNQPAVSPGVSTPANNPGAVQDEGVEAGTGMRPSRQLQDGGSGGSTDGTKSGMDETKSRISTTSRGEDRPRLRAARVDGATSSVPGDKAADDEIAVLNTTPSSSQTGAADPVGNAPSDHPLDGTHHGHVTHSASLQQSAASLVSDSGEAPSTSSIDTGAAPNNAPPEGGPPAALVMMSSAVTTPTAPSIAQPDNPFLKARPSAMPLHPPPPVPAPSQAVDKEPSSGGSEESFATPRDGGSVSVWSGSGSHSSASDEQRPAAPIGGLGRVGVGEMSSTPSGRPATDSAVYMTPRTSLVEPTLNTARTDSPSPVLHQMMSIGPHTSTGSSTPGSTRSSSSSPNRLKQASSEGQQERMAAGVPVAGPSGVDMVGPREAVSENVPGVVACGTPDSAAGHAPPVAGAERLASIQAVTVGEVTEGPVSRGVPSVVQPRRTDLASHSGPGPVAEGMTGTIPAATRCKHELWSGGDAAASHRQEPHRLEAGASSQPGTITFHHPLPTSIPPAYPASHDALGSPPVFCSPMSPPHSAVPRPEGIIPLLEDFLRVGGLIGSEDDTTVGQSSMSASTGVDSRHEESLSGGQIESGWTRARAPSPMRMEDPARVESMIQPVGTGSFGPASSQTSSGKGSAVYLVYPDQGPWNALVDLVIPRGESEDEGVSEGAGEEQRGSLHEGLDAAGSPNRASRISMSSISATDVDMDAAEVAPGVIAATSPPASPHPGPASASGAPPRRSWISVAIPPPVFPSLEELLPLPEKAYAAIVKNSPTASSESTGTADAAPDGGESPEHDDTHPAGASALSLLSSSLHFFFGYPQHEHQ